MLTKTPIPDQSPLLSSDIAKCLQAKDWAFLNRKNGLDIEALHPYPAKFIEEIPGGILDVLDLPKGAVVFDPFCGSGTTLVAAQRRGLSSIGVDLNPIGCLISRVKTEGTPTALLEAATEVIEEAKRNNSPKIPDIPNLDHWFKPEIQKPAAALLAAITKRSDDECFDALRLTLSSILVRISNQESDTRYAAIEKKCSAEDVYKYFFSNAQKIINSLNGRDYVATNARVIEHDVLTISPSAIGQKVDAVITSPPYPNAYEYWLYHKYRMWWLGFDPIAVKTAEIGARAHFFKKNHHTKDDFERQMKGVFNLSSQIMKPNGMASIVIGRSKIHGEEIDNAAIVRRAAEEEGFCFETVIVRPIAQNRKSFNLSHATIRNESIVVMRKI
jgi:site-specific DNA-methyltransferase (cytosine-N4-specific)